MFECQKSDTHMGKAVNPPSESEQSQYKRSAGFDHGGSSRRSEKNTRQCTAAFMEFAKRAEAFGDGNLDTASIKVLSGPLVSQL
jgi:hypothetical protein